MRRIKGRVSKWSNEMVWNTMARQSLVGSNPTPTAFSSSPQWGADQRYPKRQTSIRGSSKDEFFDFCIYINFPMCLSYIDGSLRSERQRQKRS